METRFANELNTALRNVESYDKAYKKIMEIYNSEKYNWISVEDKIRARDIFNFPPEQEYLFVYAGVRDDFVTNSANHKKNKQKKETTNPGKKKKLINNNENNHNTEMINHMRENDI